MIFFAPVMVATFPSSYHTRPARKSTVESASKFPAVSSLKSKGKDAVKPEKPRSRMSLRRASSSLSSKASSTTQTSRSGSQSIFGNPTTTEASSKGREKPDVRMTFRFHRNGKSSRTEDTASSPLESSVSTAPKADPPRTPKLEPRIEWSIPAAKEKLFGTRPGDLTYGDHQAAMPIKTGQQLSEQA